jgi:uncharacterized membrane protein
VGLVDVCQSEVNWQRRTTMSLLPYKKIQNITVVDVIVLPFIVRVINFFNGIFIYLHVMLLILHFLILFSPVLLHFWCGYDLNGRE